MVIGADAERAVLQDIRVLDTTHGVAGPTTTLLLAALGAEVIKVEPPYLSGHRSLSRVEPPPKPGATDQPWNRAPIFNFMNRGKLSFPLNMSKPEGIDIFKRLVRVCDVVIDNFSPRVMRNFGLEYPDLKVENPSIIDVGVSGFGSDGPWRDWVALGPGIEALTGITDLTGYPDDGPMRPGMLTSDLGAGILGAFATVAALEHRAQTGEGQFVDLSLYEINLQFVGDAIAGVSGGALPHRRAGNATPDAVPSGCYPCLEPDTWITIVVHTDSEWRTLCQAIGDLGLLDDSRFAEASSRLPHRQEIDNIISRWTAQRPRSEVFRDLGGRGIEVGRVNSAGDLLEDPHLAERGFFRRREEIEAPDVIYGRLGWMFSGIPLELNTAAPTYGQHIGYVLSSILGLSEPEALLMKETGITPDSPVRNC